MWLRAIAVAVAALASAVPASAHGSAAPTCAASQLQIGLAKSYVAAGNIGGAIGFRNRSRSTCRLRGWPTLVALHRNGTRSRAGRTRSTMFGPYVDGFPVVTLRPGRRAEAVFAAGDNPAPGRTCREPYRWLRVTPPGTERPTLVSAWLPALDAYLADCTRIVVTMVVRPSQVGA
jgi:hypothetical protein